MEGWGEIKTCAQAREEADRRCYNLTESREWKPGDVVTYKGWSFHVVSEKKKVCPDEPCGLCPGFSGDEPHEYFVCECGDLDMTDHHVEIVTPHYEATTPQTRKEG